MRLGQLGVGHDTDRRVRRGVPAEDGQRPAGGVGVARPVEVAAERVDRTSDDAARRDAGCGDAGGQLARGIDDRRLSSPRACAGVVRLHLEGQDVSARSWSLGSKSPRRCPSWGDPESVRHVVGERGAHLRGGDGSRAGHRADRKGVEDAVTATPALDLVNRPAAATEWIARSCGRRRDGGGRDRAIDGPRGRCRSGRRRGGRRRGRRGDGRGRGRRRGRRPESLSWWSWSRSTRLMAAPAAVAPRRQRPGTPRPPWLSARRRDATVRRGARCRPRRNPALDRHELAIDRRLTQHLALPQVRR